MMDLRDTNPRNPIVLDARNARGIPSTQTASSLLSQVLVITSVGFFTSAVGVYVAPAFLPSGAFWLCVIASFGLIFAVRATRRTPALSFMMFLALTLVMGFEISPWINQLLHTGHSNVVFNAAITTAVGMACIGMVAQIFTFNYARVASYAYAALLALIVVGVLSMFFHFVSPTFYSWATLAIFSVLLTVDFMRIRDGGQGSTAIELALSIYLDGLNIFLALTRIFSGGRD